MKQYSYYSFKDNVHAFLMCSRQSSEAPIIVNCFGQICQETDFFTTASRNDYYLLIMIDGNLEMRFANQSQIITKGDAVIIPPEEIYRYCNKDCKNVDYYWLHFTGGCVTKYLHSIKLQTLKVMHGITCSEITKSFDEMYLKTINHGSFLSNELALFACNVLLQVAKSQCEENNENKLFKSLAYINENYTNDIPIKVLAEIEQISISRYNYIFRNLVGTSPIKYITELRMNKAKHLLDSTFLSVSEISDMCGYANSHYFHKVFKKHFGTTPGNWRN